MYNVKNHQRQLVIQGSLPADSLRAYVSAKEGNPDAVFTIHTKSAALTDLKTLDDIIAAGEFVGNIYAGLPETYASVHFHH